MRLALTTLICGLASISPLLATQRPSDVFPDYSLTAVGLAETVYPAYHLVAVVRVGFSAEGVDHSTLQAHIKNAMSAQPQAWDCSDVNNYDVEYVEQGEKHRVNIVQAKTIDSQCSWPLPVVTLTFGENVKVGRKYTVAIKVDKVSAVSKEFSFRPGTASRSTPISGPAVFSINPQAVDNEPLTDGSYAGVTQFGIAFADPDLFRAGREQISDGAPRSGGSIYFNSVNVISTNERDQNSAFAVALGYQQGLLKDWYFPVRIEQRIQGNQVASSLQLITSAGVSSQLPWGWSRPLFNNTVVQIPISPDFALDAPYIHRLRQAVKESAQPLAEDDFGLRPSMSISHSALLKGLCRKYQSWLQGNESIRSTSSQYCLGFEANLGLWYLPRDLTRVGTQRVEGYGDVSFLIPLTNFQLPFVPNAEGLSKQGIQSQVRIQYEDSINSANNYVRTKAWSFGVELIK